MLLSFVVSDKYYCAQAKCAGSLLVEQACPEGSIGREPLVFLVGAAGHIRRSLSLPVNSQGGLGDRCPCEGVGYAISRCRVCSAIPFESC